jgi:hypothetical protein
MVGRLRVASPVKSVDHNSNTHAPHETLRELDMPFPVLELLAPLTV